MLYQRRAKKLLLQSIENWNKRKVLNCGSVSQFIEIIFLTSPKIGLNAFIISMLHQIEMMNGLDVRDIADLLHAIKREVCHNRSNQQSVYSPLYKVEV